MKKDLVQYLMVNNHLWSYDKSKIDSLPDNMLIELVLIHGDIEEIADLQDLYSKSEIKSVWEQKLVPNAYYENAAADIAFSIFNILTPFQYIREKNGYEFQRSGNIPTNTEDLL